MPLYQRKTLSTDASVGEPGRLPATLRGLSDATLADLTPLGYPDTGYFPVIPPAEPVRWIHKSIYIQRFTPQERAAIQMARASDPIIADLMYVLEQSEMISLDHESIVAGLGYLVSQALVTEERAEEVRA
jgi:hypothetical protein